MGLHCIPGGGMSSQIRLALIESVGATVVCCTPTYALRLAEIAEHEHPLRPLAESTVRLLIVAGEPGGSIPPTRERIERNWGARVIDHHGLTEVGPVSFECWEAPGYLHVNEGRVHRGSARSRDGPRRSPTASTASSSSRTWDEQPARSSVTAPATLSCGD